MDVQGYIEKLKKKVSINYSTKQYSKVFEDYDLFDAIDFLGMYGANPKPKSWMDFNIYNQLLLKVAGGVLNARILTSGENQIVFSYEEIYNKLYAFDIIEYDYSDYGTINNIRLTDLGVEIYKAWKREC